MSNIIILNASKEMDDYYKTCTIADLAKAVMDRLAGFHISYSATEYLKDVGCMTYQGNITKTGKALAHSYYCGESFWRIELRKPNETLVYERKSNNKKDNNE